jgi:hypothetical protein
MSKDDRTKLEKRIETALRNSGADIQSGEHIFILAHLDKGTIENMSVVQIASVMSMILAAGKSMQRLHDEAIEAATRDGADSFYSTLHHNRRLEDESGEH